MRVSKNLSWGHYFLSELLSFFCFVLGKTTQSLLLWVFQTTKPYDLWILKISLRNLNRTLSFWKTGKDKRRVGGRPPQKETLKEWWNFGMDGGFCVNGKRGRDFTVIKSIFLLFTLVWTCQTVFYNGHRVWVNLRSLSKFCITDEGPR